MTNSIQPTEAKEDYKVHLSKKERSSLEKLFRSSSEPKIKDRIRCIPCYLLIVQ